MRDILRIMNSPTARGFFASWIVKREGAGQCVSSMTYSTVARP